MGKERRERRAILNGNDSTPAGVDNTSRRTWNKEDFAEKAAEREAKVCSFPIEKIWSLSAHSQYTSRQE